VAAFVGDEVVDDLVMLRLVENKVSRHVLASRLGGGKGGKVILFDKLNALSRFLFDPVKNSMYVIS
jgi:hypothetical protein